MAMRPCSEEISPRRSRSVTMTTLLAMAAAAPA